MAKDDMNAYKRISGRQKAEKATGRIALKIIDRQIQRPRSRYPEENQISHQLLIAPSVFILSHNQ